jgi:hypothetical protein
MRDREMRRDRDVRIGWRKGEAMRNRVRAIGVGSVVAGILLGIGGCASDAPKSTSTVTPEQVRGHADKAFEKLKQEEQGRSTDPAMPR